MYGPIRDPPAAPRALRGPVGTRRTPGGPRRHRRTPFHRRLPGLGGPQLLLAQPMLLVPMAAGFSCYLGTLIEKGVILLAKDSWLVSRAAARLPIVRRQDTPAESCVVPERCSRGPEMFRTFPTFRTFRTCRTMFRTKVAIWGFSVTRQTAMPIRIVPRFCARGYCRIEKLLYGLSKPIALGETHRAGAKQMLEIGDVSFDVGFEL